MIKGVRLMGSRHPTSDDSTVAITGNNDPTKNYTENYTYDPIGNILTKTLNPSADSTGSLQASSGQAATITNYMYCELRNAISV